MSGKLFRHLVVAEDLCLGEVKKELKKASLERRQKCRLGVMRRCLNYGFCELCASQFVHAAHAVPNLARFVFLLFREKGKYNGQARGAVGRGQSGAAGAVATGRSRVRIQF